MQASIRALLEDRLSISPPLAVAALVGVLALSATGMQLLRGFGSTSDSGSVDTHPPVITAPPADPLPLILSADVFGAAPTASNSAAVGVPAPQEATGFILRAAFAAENGTGGAIIENSSGQADWYRVGQSVAPGLILKEVHPDHVLFDRSGSPERLQFERLSDTPAAQSVQASAESSAGGSPVFALEPDQPQPIPQDLAPEEKANLIRQRLEELRNRTRK